MNRRPLKSRGARWAQALSGYLARRRVRPNWISLASVFFAAVAGASLTGLHFTQSPARRIALLITAAACIQLRLVCNLCDGMVAVEGGMHSPGGEIFNDLPDRIADVLILVGAGYANGATGWGPLLGWTAGVLAMLTAYVRVLGASAGAQHAFIGPMAKPHRMAAMTLAALISVGECAYGFRGRVLLAALALIAFGCLITVVRRLARIMRELQDAA